MREIRFKFWNRELRKMSKAYGLGVIWESLCEEWGIFDWADVDKLQFTNFKDNFDKEVYGGDRCEITVNDYYSDANLTLEDGDVFRGIVKMIDYMWVVQDTDKTEIPLYNILCDEMDIKVIGNICEK